MQAAAAASWQYYWIGLTWAAKLARGGRSAGAIRDDDGGEIASWRWPLQ
jgi:hypothetical protein